MCGCCYSRKKARDSSNFSATHMLPVPEPKLLVQPSCCVFPSSVINLGWLVIWDSAASQRKRVGGWWYRCGEREQRKRWREKGWWTQRMYKDENKTRSEMGKQEWGMGRWTHVVCRWLTNWERCRWLITPRGYQLGRISLDTMHARSCFVHFDHHRRWGSSVVPLKIHRHTWWRNSG